MCGAGGALQFEEKEDVKVVVVVIISCAFALRMRRDGCWMPLLLLEVNNNDAAKSVKPNVIATTVIETPTIMVCQACDGYYYHL
jgi:hypothetical protein